VSGLQSDLSNSAVKLFQISITVVTGVCAVTFADLETPHVSSIIKDVSRIQAELQPILCSPLVTIRSTWT